MLRRCLAVAAAATAFLLAATPASAGPVAVAIRAICVPWTNGAPANTLADAATRAGFKPKWTSNHLESIELPQPGVFTDPVVVQLRTDRLGCTIFSSYSDARALGFVLQDINTYIAAATAPDFKFTQASDATVAGKRTITFTATAADIVVRDMPDALMATVTPGARTFEVNVRSKRPAPKVAAATAPPKPAGPTHRDEQSCAYKKGSGKIDLIMTRQKYTPAGGYDGGVMALVNGATVPAEELGYTFAESRKWYTDGAPITFKGRKYVKADKTFATAKVISPTELTFVGEFDGVPLFSERVYPGSPPPSAAAAAILWVLYPRLRCEFQPYVPAK